jgi:peptide/nickel transport system permease protein
MTEIGTIAQEGPSAAHSAAERVPLESRGFLRDTMGEVARRLSARCGIVWIIAIALIAVFAPFLANSMPLAIKQRGHWSFPLFQFLTPADVILQILFWTIAIVYLGRDWSRWVCLSICGFALLLIVLSLMIVRPPTRVVYDVYRNATNAGQVESIWHVPIPFSPADHLRDQPLIRLKPPTPVHLLGTTSDSADLLSNMIYATRIALSIGFISTGIAVVIGVFLGGLMGYFGGLVDLLGMRLAEIFNAIPTLLLLLCFVAVFEPNLYVMMAIIGFTSWVGYATFVRAEFLSLRDRDFVHAARAAGIPLHSILFRHMLPNGITPVLISASFGVAGAILIESTLSFLGIGLVGEASWGGLLNQATGEGGNFYWWIALYPGLAIFLTVFAYNLIGEALRDALDPKLLKR